MRPEMVRKESHLPAEYTTVLLAPNTARKNLLSTSPDFLPSVPAQDVHHHGNIVTGTCASLTLLPFSLKVLLCMTNTLFKNAVL